MFIKKMNRSIVAALFVVWPSQVVVASRPLPGWAIGLQIGREEWEKEGKLQDKFSQEIEAAGSSTGRSDSDPICVALNESFSVDGGGPFDNYGYKNFKIGIPTGSGLTCTVVGAEQGEYYELSMYSYTDNRYCSINNNGSVDPECSIGGVSQEYVDINFYYSGSPSTINLVCNNEPCIPAVCGDGYCSDGFETPLAPTGATDESCKEDCGLSCGDGVCDAEIGEDETSCIADCFLCIEIDKTIEYLAPGDTEEFTVDL